MLIRSSRIYGCKKVPALHLKTTQGMFMSVLIISKLKAAERDTAGDVKLWDTVYENIWR